MIRVATFAAMLAVCGLTSGADSEPVKVSKGDQIVLYLTGEVAKDYCRRCGTKARDIAAVETTATVTGTKDGQISFETQNACKRAGLPDTLVELVGVADGSKLTTRITPKESRVYSSPKATTYKLTTYESKTTVLSLSELKGLKLRTWTLTEDAAK